jgi:hypothetical protein
MERPETLSALKEQVLRPKLYVHDDDDDSFSPDTSGEYHLNVPDVERIIVLKLILE